MNINDAVVLVTGANRGLGKALVEASLAAGARKVYAAARDPKQLEAVVRQAPDRVVAVALDITDDRSLQAAAARAADLTVLINNAGVLASYNLLTSSTEDITQEFTTNVFGTLAATKAFLPALERAGVKGKAALVNILSVASLANLPSLGAYSASKAASFSLTQALRGDLAKRNISVHAVLAGSMDTDMVRTIEMPKSRPEDVAKAVIEGVEQGLEDIVPDVLARDFFATWKRDPKELERRFASMAGG